MTLSARRRVASIREPVRASLGAIPSFFVQPVQLVRGYGLGNLRPDIVAGLTVAVVLLPQAIAYALIAELPPQTGLYAAIVAAIVGGLWGSSNHLQTGPTNAISLLILSTAITMATPGTAEFLVLAGMMAVMAGVLQLVMGLARLGMLVNFVSQSVVVGFSAGAGVLIAAEQVGYLLGLEFSSHGLLETVGGIVAHVLETHLPTMALGLGTILLIVLLRRLNPRCPDPLIGMVAAALTVGVLSLDQQGVAVIGGLPRSLPPLARLPLPDLRLIAQLSAGTLAVAAIGLVEAMSFARSVASHQIFVAVTGITDGTLLSGVRYRGDEAETDSLVLRGETGTRRLIHTEHLISRPEAAQRASSFVMDTEK